MIPTIGQACAMNSLAYQAEGEIGDESGWVRHKNINCSRSGCAIVHWKYPDGTEYLSVRGTHGRRDAVDDVRIFFGLAPKARINFLEEYIDTHCMDALRRDTLMVGGHSMGGMIAMGAAARWRLPGLVQNAPGWLANPPSPESLARLLEIRTGRDVVGAWGHGVPNTIIVHDPEAAKWDLRRLHNRHHQATLIERTGLSQMRLDDPGLQAHHSGPDNIAQSFSTIGWMHATWKRVNREHALATSLPRKPSGMKR